MKQLWISILAVAALAATPAFAADKDKDHHGHSQNQGDHGGNQGDHHGKGGDHGDGHGNGWGNGGQSGGHAYKPVVRVRTNVTIHPVIVQRRVIVRPIVARPRNWNMRPRTFDIHIYQGNFNSAHRYHWNPYNRPHGWYVHRWGYGEMMPRAFWVRDYWVNDWWSFGLTIPPYGYEWVRYGDDAVLINVNNGRVLRVMYGVYD